MGLKTFLKNTKKKIQNKTKTSRNGLVGGSKSTVDDADLGPRVHVLHAKNHDAVPQYAHSHRLKDRFRNQLGRIRLYAMFKQERKDETENDSTSKTVNSFVSASAVSKVPHSVSFQQAVMVGSVAEDEMHVMDPNIFRSVFEYDSAQATIGDCSTDLVLLGLHQLTGMVSEHIRQIVHTVNIAKKEIQVLKPVTLHTKVAMHIHLHALSGQRIEKRHIRQSLLLFLHCLGRQPQGTLGKRVLELLFERVTSVGSLKRRRRPKRRLKPINPIESHGCVGKPTVQAQARKLLGSIQQKTDVEDSRQTNEVFFDEDADTVPSDIIEVFRSDGADLQVNESSADDNPEQCSSHKGSPTSSVIIHDTRETTKSVSDEAIPPGSLTSEGEDIGELAKVYNCKEAVIRDYDFALANRQQQHEFNLEELREEHEDNIKDIKKFHAQELERVYDQYERELNNVRIPTIQDQNESRQQQAHVAPGASQLQAELAKAHESKQSLEAKLDRCELEYRSLYAQFEKTRKHNAEFIEASSASQRLQYKFDFLEDKYENVRHKVEDEQNRALRTAEERDRFKHDLDRLQVLYKAALQKHFAFSKGEAADGAWSSYVMKPDQVQDAAQALIVSQGMHKQQQQQANDLQYRLEASERLVRVHVETIAKLEGTIAATKTTLSLRENVQSAYDRSFAAIALRNPSAELGDVRARWTKAVAKEKIHSQAHLDAAVEAFGLKHQLEKEQRERGEEVQDLKRALTETRQELTKTQLELTDANGDKSELETALEEATEERNCLEGSAGDGANKWRIEHLDRMTKSCGLGTINDQRTRSR